MGRSKSLKNKIALLLPPAFWLGVWQLGAFLVDRRVGGRGNELLLPYPVTVARALIRLGQTGEFWQTVLVSLGRILAGMGAGTLLGAVLAAAACASPWAGRLIALPVRVIRATPVASFILLILLWTDRTFVPRGHRRADGAARGVGQSVPGYPGDRPQAAGTGGGLSLFLVEAGAADLSAQPAALFPGRRHHRHGPGLEVGVAAEVLCIPRPAIGTQIYNSKLYLDIPDLFAWTVAVVALSLLLEGLLRALLERDKRREDGA